MIGRTSSKKPSKNNDETGFTLLEILVSLSILVLILSFIPNTLGLSTQVWKRQSVLRLSAAQSSFQYYIEQRLAEAMATSRRDGEGNVVANFEGMPNAVRFVAQAAAGPGGGGVYLFELAQKDLLGRRGRALVLRQQIYPAKPNQLSSSSPDMIVHTSPVRIGNLSLRYFGRPGPGAELTWQARWPRRETLPNLIEISISAPGQKQSIERRIVELKLRPRRR